MYLQGYSTTEIGELANVTARYIRMILKENNVEMRARGSWKRKYKVNEHYFKTWSNEMAYILGFFMADGSVTSNGQSISFSQKEKYILEEIKREMNSNHPIIKNAETGVYTLNLNSKVLKDDMINIHGIKPRKSYDAVFPNVPDKFLPHFIRGYFDGDGFVNYEKRVVSFVGGSMIFMKSLERILQSMGFEPQFIQNKNYFRLIITGRRSIKLFAEIIYKNKNLYIKRKFNNFEKETLDLNELKDRHLKTTKVAVIKRKNDFLIEFQKSKCINNSCTAIGIQKSTFNHWRRNDENFRRRLEEINQNHKW